MNLFITGGGGLLGSTLIPLLKERAHEVIAPARKELDILDERALSGAISTQSPDLILHLAAYTDVAGAEKEKAKAYITNVIGTRNVCEASPMKRIVYLSTDYVFDGQRGDYKETDAPNPINYYALTKLIGEEVVRTDARGNIIIRTSFKPRPFEHPKACIDLFTSADYVDVIAKEILLALEMFELLPQTIHIGTGRKSVYDLAKQTNPDVSAIERKDITSVKLPYDTSLNTERWETLKERYHNIHKNDVSA